jgi:hypothetical protein
MPLRVYPRKAAAGLRPGRALPVLAAEEVEAEEAAAVEV